MAVTINASNNTGLVVTPDNTSTIQFQSNSVTAMTIDSSQNIGIGTTTPLSKITLGGQTGATSTPLSLRFSGDYSNTSNASGCKIFWYNNSPVDIYGIGVGNASDVQYHAYQGSGNGSHNFYTENTLRMKIDGSGRMTRPTHPGFIAISTSGTATYTTGQKVVYNQLVKDFNSNYSTANSRFTAPVAGLYMVKAQLWIYTGSSGSARFAVNGTITYGAFGNESTNIGFNGIAMVEIFYLNANDYVEVFCRASTVYTDANYSTFSGFLIS